MRYLVVVTEVDENGEFVKVLHMLLTSDGNKLCAWRDRIRKHYGTEQIRMKTFTEKDLIDLLGVYDFD